MWVECPGDVTPKFTVSTTPALRHEAADGRDFTYMGAYNVTGWPVVVVRAGISDTGLPIGVQVIARPWRDDVALAIAQHIETTFGGWQPPSL